LRSSTTLTDQIRGNLTETAYADLQDWSFAYLKQAETLWGPHGYHRYPAKFIPQLVRRIIESYSEPGALVGDPFLGSGTTGVEALRAGRRFWGSDINPVAILISQAKCIPISPQLLDSIWEQFETKLPLLQHIGRRSLTDEEKEVIKAIDIAHASPQDRLAYWFPSAYRLPLEYLLEMIQVIQDKLVRTFFLCAFSNILRRCSIWLSGSTKPQKDLQKTLSDPVEAFRAQVRDMLRGNRIYWADLLQLGIDPGELIGYCYLVLEDARHLSLEQGSLDLLVTSPPYATCYEYIEIHQLTQLWYEQYQVLPHSNLRHACIGSKIVRGIGTESLPLGTGSTVADATLSQLASIKTNSDSDLRREVRALQAYFQDMYLAIQEFGGIVSFGKRLVLIIGDSYKRGVTIPTSDALSEMAQNVGFELEHKIVRKIPARVLVSTRDKSTGRFSSTAQSDTQVYPEEDILVFRRKAGNSAYQGDYHG